MAKPRVIVGLSGGVDSSVAAALLQQQGYEVIGLTLWLMKGKGQCCSEGLVDAARICEQLGIPHEVVDSRDRFARQIVDYLVEGYSQGITPLPCSQCNRSVKFAPMLAYAQQTWGSDCIATGHYARITYDATRDRYQLWRGGDRQKDQSYFLYDLPQSVLAHTLFPLGDQTKEQTRQWAATLGLATASKAESQDLCLIEAHGSMQSFLDQYLGQRPGDIVDTQGRVLGQHQGIHHYTIGQRRGLGIAAPQPLYVLALDAQQNRVIVGDRHAAEQHECEVQRVNWVSIAQPDHPIRAQVQVRYRAEPVAVTVVPLAGQRVQLQFHQPQFGLTPGQAAVWYDGDCLLGGGIIAAFAQDTTLGAKGTAANNPAFSPWN